MIRVRAVGTGWTGGPGLTTFYFSEGVLPIDNAMAVNLTGRVRAYFDAVRPYTASGISWQVDPVIAAINAATGLLTQEVSANPAPAPVTGSGGAVVGPAFVALVGRLRTNAFQDGRRIQGRTFYSPLSSQFTDSTTPESGAQAAQVAGLTALLTTGGGAPLVVWQRPKPGRPGAVFSVDTVSSAPEFGVLRSRR